MRTLTEQVIEASNGILKISPEVTDNEGKGYAMADTGAVSYEDAEYLWGLVRLIKPKHILETGTFTGLSSLYMAQALKENGRGDLVTLEVEMTHKLRAEDLWRKCGVSDYVTCKLQSSLEFQTQEQYELIFLDSEPQTRFIELVKFFPYLMDAGFLLIHDLHGHLGQTGAINPDHPKDKNWPWGELPEQVKEWLKTDKLRLITLPASRGMVMFYKPKKDDYRV